MALTNEEVVHVAKLARLRLDPADIDRLRGQLETILAQFEVLQELDVTGVPTTAQVTDLFNVLRDDVVRPSLPRAAALANAPDASDGQFRVRTILEE